METATQALHRLTSYVPERAWTAPVDDPRVLQDLQVNDMSRLPWPYKRYPRGLPRLELPRDLPETAAPALAVLAGMADVPAQALSVAHLSRLLYWSAGVVRTTEMSGGRRFLFRAAGSAGARFPLEVYVAVPERRPVSGYTPLSGALPAGVHWYDPLEHALVRIGPAPGGGAPAVIVTGVPWRTGWRYRERGYRHVYWDAGTMLAQLLALADSAGLAARLYTRFPDAAAAALTGADLVHEFPVAVVSLGELPPALAAGGDSAAGETDAAPLEFPLVTAAQRAAECERLGEPWDGDAAAYVPMPASPPVEAVIAARGSQRRMDASRGLPRDVLRTCMGVALRGISVPHWVAVHDVADTAPGVYRWPDLDSPVRAGALRDEVCRVCLGQSLGRDAAFVAIAATDVGRLSDREYREAQLAAGLAEGRLHLGAYALGAGASGMTFLDSEVPALLGEPADGLLFTCVGVPEYTSAKAGLPGAPSQVRFVMPR